eukprot:403367376
MGLRFTFGRICLGLLMIVQGIFFYQNGFKEQYNQMKDLRGYCLRNDILNSQNLVGQAICLFGTQSDQVITGLIYAQVILMIVSGSLIIANLKQGGLLMSMAMFLLVITRDNPLLGSSDTAWRSNFQNMLRDIAVAGMGLLVFMRREVIRHRKPPARYE